ncbi:MAG: hypothetical protein GF320_13235 [Armatimonadia bacterium]|nr:hypothetical protein [Armatimonadia bacterium]
MRVLGLVVLLIVSMSLALGCGEKDETDTARTPEGATVYENEDMAMTFFVTDTDAYCEGPMGVMTFVRSDEGDAIVLEGEGGGRIVKTASGGYQFESASGGKPMPLTLRSEDAGAQ